MREREQPCVSRGLEEGRALTQPAWLARMTGLVGIGVAATRPVDAAGALVDNHRDVASIARSARPERVPVLVQACCGAAAG
jgi:hypothetical protein